MWSAEYGIRSAEWGVRSCECGIGHARKRLTKVEFMTTRKQLHFGMKYEQSDKAKKALINQRDRRYFSESARRSIVEEIEKGLSKSEAARRYNVSQTSIYRWVVKYSKYYEKCLKTVVEHESDSVRLKRLEVELKEVYARLGQERARSVFFEELISTAEENLGIDLKKSSGTKSSSSCTTKKDTPPCKKK
jgi:transposase